MNALLTLRAGLLTLAGTALIGMGSAESEPPKGPSPQSVSGQPSKVEGAQCAPSSSNRILAGKSIQINVTNVPDEDKSRINGTYAVSEAGMLTMPMIGPVKAAGLKDSELAEVLKSKYRAKGIYRDPQIQVLSTGCILTVERGVTVGGQVRKPGPVPYSEELTLRQGIQAAGGATEFGSLKRVVVYRDGKQSTYDLSDPNKGDVKLQRNDTIEVPRKPGVFGN